VRGTTGGRARGDGTRAARGEARDRRTHTRCGDEEDRGTAKLTPHTDSAVANYVPARTVRTAARLR